MRRVLFWGRFDHGYSKTRVNIATFRALGWDVDFFDVKWCCKFGDVEAFFRGVDRRGKYDLVFVPVCRQRDIKVYESLACARPTINEFCTGYPPSAKECKAIKFIPAGDAQALVNAVEEYRADWANKELYFKSAREFFERELSMDVVKRQLAGVLEQMGFQTGGNYD